MSKYSESGSKYRSAEEQTWINFVDFLDECEGNLYDEQVDSGTSYQFIVIVQEEMFHVR